MNGQVGMQNGTVVLNSKLDQFWQGVSRDLEEGKSVSDRHHELPMARIKKIMKMDDSVQQCVGPLDRFRTR